MYRYRYRYPNDLLDIQTIIWDVHFHTVYISLPSRMMLDGVPHHVPVLLRTQAEEQKEGPDKNGKSWRFIPVKDGKRLHNY